MCKNKLIIHNLIKNYILNLNHLKKNQLLPRLVAKTQFTISLNISKRKIAQRTLRGKYFPSESPPGLECPERIQKIPSKLLNPPAGTPHSHAKSHLIKFYVLQVLYLVKNLATGLPAAELRE